MEKEIIAKWTIKESETQRILKLLPQLVESTRNEKGNIAYNVYQSESNENEIVLHERYADNDALEAHKTSEHYVDIVAKQIIPHLEIREVSLLKKLY